MWPNSTDETTQSSQSFQHMATQQTAFLGSPPNAAFPYQQRIAQLEHTSQAWPNNKSCSKISTLPGSTASKPFSPECTALNLINSMKSMRLVWGKRPLRMHTSTVSNGDMHAPPPLFSTPTPVLPSRVLPPDALRPPQPISSVIHHASEFEMLQKQVQELNRRISTMSAHQHHHRV